MNDQASKLDPGTESPSRTCAAAASSDNHLDQVLKGQAQQAEFRQHMLDTTDADATGSPPAGDCTDRGHSATRGNAVRGDAAKHLVRVVRDGSTTEGRRLRKNLWAWLHVQDEEATELFPRQVQSWLTGEKTQQRKAFGKNRRHHPSQTARATPHAVRQGLRTATPTNLDLTEGWARRLRPDGTNWKTSEMVIRVWTRGSDSRDCAHSIYTDHPHDERPGCGGRLSSLCRCERDHEQVTLAEGRRTRKAQEYPRQFCEVMVTAVKASLLHRDRGAPVQPMTLEVRENDEPADDERDTDSGLDEGDAPADDLQPTESQTKMVDQCHRNLGHPSHREFLKVLKAANAKPVVLLKYVRRGYRCADCDAHSRPQPSPKAAVRRTHEFNRIIALDVFYVPLRGQSLPVLSISVMARTSMSLPLCKTGRPRPP